MNLLAQGAAQDLVAVLGDPDDVKAMIIDGVFSGGDYANQQC